MTKLDFLFDAKLTSVPLNSSLILLIRSVIQNALDLKDVAKFLLCDVARTTSMTTA